MSLNDRSARTRLLFAFLVSLLALSLAPFASAAKYKDDVKKAQQSLHDKGYDPGPIDGVMGAQTRDAIGQYQQSQGLPATRHLDDKTADQLGVEHESGENKYKAAGHNFKEGGKRFAHEIKEGKPGEAGKDLGKGVGRGGKDVGEGVKQDATQ